MFTRFDKGYGTTLNFLRHYYFTNINWIADLLPFVCFFSLICLLTLWKLLRIGSLVGVALSSSSSSSSSPSFLLFATMLSLLNDLSVSLTGIFSFSQSLMDWLLASFLTPSISTGGSSRTRRQRQKQPAAGGGSAVAAKSSFPPQPAGFRFSQPGKRAADVSCTSSVVTCSILVVPVHWHQPWCRFILGDPCSSAPRFGRVETSRHKLPHFDDWGFKT